MKKQQETIINKIDVDENTAEPIIVEVSEKELKNIERQSSKYHEHDFVSRRTDKSIGKQMTMERVLGLNKEVSSSPNKRQKILKISITIIFAAFVVGVLFATAYKDFFGNNENRNPLSWDEMKVILSNSWFFLLLALVSLGLCFLFKGLKLSIMCKPLTGKFHFKTCLETGIIGHYYNNVTPLAVGGQPFEIYHLSTHGIRGGVATSLPIVTFFLNQLAFVVLGIISLFLINKNPLAISFSSMTTLGVMATIGLISCIFLPAVVILFSLFPRVGASVVRLVIGLGGKLKLVKDVKKTSFKTMRTVAHNSKCIKKLATRPLSFNLSFLFSFCEQLSAASISFFTLKLFGFNFGTLTGIWQWVAIAQMYLILCAAIAFIPTPGNSGAADLSFFALFESGLAVGLAFPAMLTWRLLAFYSYIMVGFLFAVMKKKSDKKKALNNQPIT